MRSAQRGCGSRQIVRPQFFIVAEIRALLFIPRSISLHFDRERAHMHSQIIRVQIQLAMLAMACGLLRPDLSISFPRRRFDFDKSICIVSCEPLLRTVSHISSTHRGSRKRSGAAGSGEDQQGALRGCRHASLSSLHSDAHSV